MAGRGNKNVGLVVALAMAGAMGGLGAAEESTEDPPAWSNSTDLSIVVTDGNSKTETFGFKNTLIRNWDRANFRLKVNALRSDTADDRFVLVDAGLEWEPGEDPPMGGGSVVEPDLEPDVERYFIEGRYHRDITKRLGWNAGGSWERNEDAGILNRTIVFGGLGHQWKNDKDLKFSTTYGLSFTDREEDEPDPEKEDKFLGLRLSWDYLDRFGKVTVYQNDFTANVSLEDTSDYSLDMTNAISVNLSNHLALKVSLQWLYESEPALEEVDLLAFVDLVDPDGIPGNGDEFFRSVGSGGAEIEVGDIDIRKDELDTIFRTSLVINF